MGNLLSLSRVSAGLVKPLWIAAVMLCWMHPVQSVERQEAWRAARPGPVLADAGNKGTDVAKEQQPEAAPKPLDAKALLARGDDFTIKGDLDRAIADYDAALKADPSFAEALHSRGMAWRAKGNRRRALADFDAALKLKPDFEAARSNRKNLAQEIERLGVQMPLKEKGDAK